MEMKQNKKHKNDMQTKESGILEEQADAGRHQSMSTSNSRGSAKDSPMNMLTPGHFLGRPLELLLAEGGDPRLAINPLDNLNSYGCRPSPRPEAISFSST